MYALLRSLLFCLPPEIAHHFSLEALEWLPASIFPKPKENPISAMGLSFPHRIGLAAGLDKNGAYIKGLSKLGFAFIEIGSITPKAQSGNPKPRLFRIPRAKALINRMGFNNEGVDALIAHVLKASFNGILGINLGKNKETPLDKAVDDYLFCFKKVYPLASYVTINISSPNTQGLRILQEESYLNNLIKALKETQASMADQYGRFVPLVIKLSPDEEDGALKRIAHQLVQAGIEGVIATNTTANHQTVAQYKRGGEQGGVSGSPLFARSTECLKIIKSIVGADLTLIAAGGIDSLASAEEKLDAGASLLQIYTGLIYEGPKLLSMFNTSSSE